jgi:hypothetical protein
MKLIRRVTPALSVVAVSLALLSHTGQPSTGSNADAPEAGSGFAQAEGRTGPLSKTEASRSRLLGRLVLKAQGAAPSSTILRQNGFVQVSTAPKQHLRMVSTGDSVTMTTPYVYWDTTYFRYTAVAKYRWDGDYWENKGGGNVGGPDGFGLRFDRKMDNRGVTGQFSGKGLAFGTSIVTNPADNSSNGVAYTKQDKAQALAGNDFDYNMKSGVVTMTVGRPACGTTTHLYSRYFHTWSDASVTGFDISLTGFGVSWTSDPQKWYAASQAGTWKITC